MPVYSNIKVLPQKDKLSEAHTKDAKKISGPARLRLLAQTATGERIRRGHREEKKAIENNESPG